MKSRCNHDCAKETRFPYPNVKLQDPGGQQIGFLLGSCGVTWALTTEACFKTLPKDDAGNVVHFKGAYALNY